MAEYKTDACRVNFTPAAETAVGALVQIAGVVGIVDPTNHGGPLAAGELGSVTVEAIVRINNSGIVFAEGAVVGYDASADEAVAAAGGDFNCGTVTQAFGSGDAVVEVLLNAGI